MENEFDAPEVIDDHIDEPTPEVTPEPEVPPTEGEPAPEPEIPAEEYDVIKWKGQEVKVPVTERQTYIQKGYDYDRQREIADKYSTDLQRVAKFSGYDDVESFIEAVAQAEENQRIQTEAERIAAQMGVSQEQAEQFLKNQLAPLQKEVQDLRSKDERNQQEAFNAQVLQTTIKMEQKYTDFREHSPAVFDYLREMNMPPTEKAFESAYKVVTYDSVRTKTEQEVLANVTGRGAKQVLSSGDKGADVKIDINSMSSEEFKKFREDASRRAAMGETVIF